MTQRANIAESFEQSLIPELMDDLAGCEVPAPCSRRVRASSSGRATAIALSGPYSEPRPLL
jgi:hypothetical protein